MIFTLVYVLLAVLALSFLIFIHELGHYVMARLVGMRVETFAIGFGKPIWVFERQGVKWQVGWLPFGGYVKIAGMENDDQTDPYSIKDGFFGKRPWDRIKVAFMGPLVNIVFAFFVFFILWLCGGREKNFAEYTKIAGWVDPKSQVFALGIRPGDEILSLGGNPYQGAKDLVYAPMTAFSKIEVTGINRNLQPFSLEVKPYPHPNALQKGILTMGILQPAHYLLYDRLPNGQDNPLPEGSPMEKSGIQYGDRLVWIDGERLFSMQELETLLNDGRAYLTIKRGGEKVFARVPRIQIQEMRLNPLMKEELKDWQFEASLKEKLPTLLFIPYNLTQNGVVEEAIKLIDKEHQSEAFPEHPFSSLEYPLLPGDKIIAVDGKPVNFSFEIFKELQERKVHLIVERKPVWQAIPSQEEDLLFNTEIHEKDLKVLSDSIGTHSLIKTKGNLVLLEPVSPKPRSAFPLSKDKQALQVAEMLEKKKRVESIQDQDQREQAKQLLEKAETQLLLGVPIQDRKVLYNPSPIALFSNVFKEIERTLSALFTGSLNPKWLSGPIGIVQVVYGGWLLSFKEVLFWIGAISLNLGILNLLPIPVLDGGTIVLSFFEWITGKKIPPKSLEKLIFPFAILLIGFFIYFTYNDLMRLFS